MTTSRGLALLLLVTLCLACDGGSSGPSKRGEASPAIPTATTAAGCSRAASVGSSLQGLTVDGLERSYRLHVPAGYDAGKPPALVFNFHGFAGIASDQEAYTGVVATAEANGFIAVTPDGSGKPQRWNVGPGILGGEVDDARFVRELIDSLSASLCIDQRRVYAMGISNGGFFSSVLACELNDRIAAVATVAGELFPEARCEGKQPVPIIVFHGTDDMTVRFEGTARSFFRSSRTTMARWADFNGCETEARSERVVVDVLLETYRGCRNGADVQLYVVEGGGHSWPGADDVAILGRTTHSIAATDLIWRFFAAHPRS